MSLLFDQNLSRRLVALLADVYPNSNHVMLAGLADVDDLMVWSFAATNGLAIVSKDSDFQVLSRTRGSPPKVVWLRIGNGPTRDVESLLRSRCVDVCAFLADPAQALLELP
jgi:predicted nuclease of predicted toxin-antitoxin system